MHARESRAGSHRTLAASLVAGQTVLHDLRAGSSIVALEGDLRLDWRVGSLAWLGDAVPLTSITLHEGERFVAPQSGIVSISAAQAKTAQAKRLSDTRAAAFLVLRPRAQPGVQNRIRDAAQHVAALVRTRLRRAA